jgi:hypothetical protein
MPDQMKIAAKISDIAQEKVQGMLFGRPPQA